MKGAMQGEMKFFDPIRPDRESVCEESTADAVEKCECYIPDKVRYIHRSA